jgi:tRNA(fMet)-specific endonuclease VapC
MAARYLLDTNICIYIAKNKPQAVRSHFDRHAANELAMSVVTYGELRYGAERSQARERALQAIGQLCTLIEVHALSETTGERYGRIRAELAARGMPIGNNDLWIAAHALSQDWILVTNNEREFARIDGLRIENWAV